MEPLCIAGSKHRHVLGPSLNVLQTLFEKQIDEPLSRATVHVQVPTVGDFFLCKLSKTGTPLPLKLASIAPNRRIETLSAVMLQLHKKRSVPQSKHDCKIPGACTNAGSRSLNCLHGASHHYFHIKHQSGSPDETFKFHREEGTSGRRLGPVDKQRQWSFHAFLVPSPLPLAPSPKTF